MNIDWRFVLSALGLALIIEGIPYFAFAEKMPQFLSTLQEQSPTTLRILGMVAMIAGLLLFYFCRPPS